MKKTRNVKSLEAVTHTHTHNTFTKILKIEKSNCRGRTSGDPENRKNNIKQNVGVAVFGDPEKNKNYNVGTGLVSAHAITLITLVITIVILILLASIVINLALKDNGLISKTKEANEATIISDEEEKIQLAYLNIVSEDYEKEITTETLKNQIESYTKLDTIVEKQKFYYDSLNEKYYLYYKLDGEEVYSEKDLQNVYELKNKDYSNISLEDFFIVSFPEKNRWYSIDSSGETRVFKPMCEIIRETTTSTNTISSRYIYFVPGGYSVSSRAILYATNKALGVSGQSRTILDNDLVLSKLKVGFRYSSPTYGGPNMGMYTLDIRVGSTIAVMYFRPYIVIENSLTGDSLTFYGDVVHVTYNEVLALENEE
jgi:hypothetical protein